MTTSSNSAPGAQFEASAMSIINTLRHELSNAQFQVLTMRAQLEAADSTVSDLHAQLAQALSAARDAQALAEIAQPLPPVPPELVAVSVPDVAPEPAPEPVEYPADTPAEPE